MSEADPLRRLIHAFSRLPGIGEKTATRLAFFALQSEESVSRELAQSLIDAREKVRLCSSCCNYTQGNLCRFCDDPRRDNHIICVVESVSGLMAIEATGEFNGRYHVLHGTLAPLDGIGPDEIRLKELVPRLAHGVEEVIVATNPSMGGEVTATYIQKWLCMPLGIRVTRIASGVPMGADLEYADQVTLTRALEGRREL